jgi:LysM repeat protein
MLNTDRKALKCVGVGMHGRIVINRSSTIQRVLRVMVFIAVLLASSASTFVRASMGSAPVHAKQFQPGDCAADIQQALAHVGDVCQEMGRNQACYGNDLINVQLRQMVDIQRIDFAQVGDIADLTVIERIETSAYDEAENIWGIALLKAQVNLPRALPGQNVTFVLYGDVTLEAASPIMRAFTVQTRVGGAACAEVPTSALLIQTPDNRRVRMEINGAELVLGSTAHVTSIANDEMIIGLLEGTGILNVEDEQRILVPGSEVWMPLGGDDGLTIIDAPSEVRPFDLNDDSNLPLDLLDRPVEVPPPVPDSDETVDDAETAEPDATPDENTAACIETLVAWEFVYEIQPGDTLSEIASAAGVDLATLIGVNCIADASRIVAGTVIRVPVPIRIEPISTPNPTTDDELPDTTPTPTDDPNSGGGVITIAADPSRILLGQCTTISWTVDSIVGYTATILGRNMPGYGSLVDCPLQTMTYTLIVSYDNGQIASASVTVEVDGIVNLNRCGDEICEPDFGENILTCSADCK